MADTRSTQDLTRRFFQAVKALKTYGADHPQGRNAMSALKVELLETLAEESEILFLCQGDSLLVQKIAQPSKDPITAYLLEVLNTHGVSSLTFQAGVPGEEVERCIQLLAAKPEQVMTGNDIKPEFSGGYTKVQINSVRYVAITDYDAVINTLQLLPDKEESKRFASAILNLSKKEKSQRAAPGDEGPSLPASELVNVHPAPADLPPRIQDLLKEGSSPEAKRLILDYLVNCIAPGDVPLAEQIREVMGRIPESLQTLFTGLSTGMDVSAALVAHQIESSADLKLVRKAFQELAPRPDEALALLEAIAKALKSTGREVSPETLKRVMEFLPQLEQMAEDFRGNVLIVDGDANRRAAYKRAISERSWAVDTAATAKEAIEKVMAREDVDAIVMDIHLPDKKGGVILSRLLQENRRIPVVIAAAKASGYDYDFEIFSYPKKRILQSQEPEVVASAVTDFAIRRDRRKEMVGEEGLARAREIQEKLIPRQVPPAPGWQIAFSSRPAGEIGSDYLDIFMIDEGKLGILIGALSEKGVGAAVVMMRIRIAFRLCASGLSTPKDSMVQANKLIVPHIRPGTPANLLYGSLDLSRGRLRLINCAHNLPLFQLAGDGSVNRIALRGQDLPLGTEPESFKASLLEEEIEIPPGSTLVLSTRGAFKTANSQGQPFGVAAVLSALKKAGGEKAQQVIEQLDDAISHHRGDTPKYHDTTLVALKRDPVQASTGKGTP